jgi:hypothetical protein
VLAFWIVEHFDVVEHIASSFFSGFVCPPSDAFSFQQIEKAFSNSIVMTVSASAHTVLEIVVFEK